MKEYTEFDNSLVVVPSRQGFYYRLAQRRPLRLPEHVVNEALFKESDTQMLATYGLVPVTTILATVNWGNPILFEELRKRAPWRMGVADKVNATLEAQDRQDALDRRMKTDEHLTYISKDAWKMYRKKIGLGRAWNITPASSKTPFVPTAKRIERTAYFPGFSGGF